MRKPSYLDNKVEWWDSPASVAIYSAPPFLLRGERLAFDSCFPDGFKGKRVLDLGCGGGRTTHFFHEMGADVIGVDISRNLINAARQRYPHIDFREGNAESLDFDDSIFDAVLFSFNSLGYLYPKDKRINSIREVWRVLRPKGRFIFSQHNLAAVFCGWYKTLHPYKLPFRIIQIINGNIFKNDCYISAPSEGGVMTYYAWPNKVIEDMCQARFELMHIYPNSRLLQLLQNGLRTNWFTKLADTWPYYIFVKTPLKHT